MSNVSESQEEGVVMLYVFGVCERCKEPIELRLNYVTLDKNADTTARLVLYHKPDAINKTVCGGRVRIVTVSEVDDEDMRTVLPLELWQMLYEEGTSLRGIAGMFNTTQTKIRRELTARRHKIQVMPLRRVGRPSKSSRMEVQSENIIKTTS